MDPSERHCEEKPPGAFAGRMKSLSEMDKGQLRYLSMMNTDLFHSPLYDIAHNNKLTADICFNVEE